MSTNELSNAWAIKCAMPGCDNSLGKHIAGEEEIGSWHDGSHDMTVCSLSWLLCPGGI